MVDKDQDVLASDNGGLPCTSDRGGHRLSADQALSLSYLAPKVYVLYWYVWLQRFLYLWLTKTKTSPTQPWFTLNLWSWWVGTGHPLSASDQALSPSSLAPEISLFLVDLQFLTNISVPSPCISLRWFVFFSDDSGGHGLSADQADKASLAPEISLFILVYMQFLTNISLPSWHQTTVVCRLSFKPFIFGSKGCIYGWATYNWYEGWFTFPWCHEDCRCLSKHVCFSHVMLVIDM